MISEIISTTTDKMAKAVDSAKEDFANVRTGRACLLYTSDAADD